MPSELSSQCLVTSRGWLCTKHYAENDSQLLAAAALQALADAAREAGLQF
jgi:hypothetical protein